MKVRVRGSRQGFERIARLRADGTLGMQLGIDVVDVAWESPGIASSDAQLAATARQDSERVGTKDLDAIASDIASIKALLMDSTRSVTGATENHWQKVLNDARDQLQAGDAHTARQLILRVRTETASSDDKMLQFRIATNLGCAALALDDFDTALVEFRVATAIEPSAVSRANVAIALYAKRLYEEALSEAQAARNLDFSSKPAVAALIKSLAALRRFSEIDTLIAEDPSAATDDDVVLALAEARFRQGNYRAGEHYTRLLLEKPSADAHVHLLLAECIVGGVNDDPVRLLVGIDTTVQGRLRDAESHAKVARDRFAATRQDRMRLIALNNLAAIEALLGNFDGAIEYANQVLLNDATNEIALQNRGLARYQLGEFAEATQDFDALSGTEYAEAVSLPFADALLKTGNIERATALLRRIWDARLNDPQALQAGELLLHAYTEADDTEAYSALLREIEASFAAEPFAQGILALAAYRSGDSDSAIRRFEDALAGASRELQVALAPRLGDLYINQKRFADAVELYERVGLHTDPRFFSNYLKSLVNAQRYAEAYKLAQDAIASGSDEPTVFDVAGRVAIYNGDLASARVSYSRALELRPSSSSLSFRLQLAQIESQLGRPDVATDLIEPLTVDASADTDELLLIARLRTLLGLPGAVPFAYRARELAFHDPEVHLAYIRLFLARTERDQEILDATTVAVGTTVLVTVNDVPQKFRIVATSDEVKQPTDLTPESALGRQFLGKCAGDEILLRDTPIERLVARITEVTTHYVAAFRETLEQFSTWFPDNLALQKGDARNEDGLRRVADAIDKNGKSVSMLFKQYERGELSLHGFAEMVGDRLPDAWWKIVSTPGLTVLADGGDRTRLEGEYHALEGATACVIEATALLTLSYLGLLTQLTKRFGTVAVVQRTIDDLLEDRAQEETLPGRAEAEDIASQRRRHIEVIDIALKFAQNEATIVAPKALLDIKAEEVAQKARILGHGGFPSILAAAEQNAVLLSDDAVFRDVARTTWHVDGASTQTLLRHLTERAVVTTHQYRDALVHLASGGYGFLTVKADDLYWVLDRNGMQYSDEVQLFFRNLEGPRCTEDSAIAVLADLVRIVVLERVAGRVSDAALDIVMRTLIAGRPSRHVVERFKVAVGQRLRLLPLELERTLATINAWGVTQHLL